MRIKWNRLNKGGTYDKEWLPWAVAEEAVKSKNITSIIRLFPIKEIKKAIHKKSRAPVEEIEIEVGYISEEVEDSYVQYKLLNAHELATKGYDIAEYYQFSPEACVYTIFGDLVLQYFSYRPEDRVKRRM